MSTPESARNGGARRAGLASRLGGMRRRLLLLAGLGAAVGAKVASDTAQPAQAAGPLVGAPVGYSPFDPHADGVQGYAAGAGYAGTFGRNNDHNGIGVYGVAPNGTGTYGQSATGTGVGARSTSGYGVYAISQTGHGLFAASANNGHGIWSMSNTQAGVVGDSTSGWGLLGRSNASIGVGGSSSTNVGVHAVSTSGIAAYATSHSSHGLRADSVTNIGILGASTQNTAVYGSSQQHTGVVGLSASWIGVHGHGATNGIYGTCNAGGRAATFDGPVVVNGSFTVVGGAKSAAVPHPDGTHRRMYCVESPDSVFEDFGQGTLVAGRAQVRLDPEFAAVVQATAYGVFLTPEGECRGLYVTAKTPAGFEVRELQGGTSGVTFWYRVVAARKDVQLSRLEKVPLPGPAERAKRPDPPAPAETLPPMPVPPPPPTSLDPSLPEAPATPPGAAPTPIPNR